MGVRRRSAPSRDKMDQASSAAACDAPFASTSSSSTLSRGRQRSRSLALGVTAHDADRSSSACALMPAHACLGLVTDLLLGIANLFGTVFYDVATILCDNFILFFVQQYGMFRESMGENLMSIIGFYPMGLLAGMLQDVFLFAFGDWGLVIFLVEFFIALRYTFVEIIPEDDDFQLPRKILLVLIPFVLLRFIMIFFLDYDI